MKDYIQIGIDKGLISLNEDRARVTYVYTEEGTERASPHEVRPRHRHALFRRLCRSAVCPRLLSRKLRFAIASQRKADGDSAPYL